jgi:hypothetical protein
MGSILQFYEKPFGADLCDPPVTAHITVMINLGEQIQCDFAARKFFAFTAEIDTMLTRAFFNEAAFHTIVRIFIVPAAVTVTGRAFFKMLFKLVKILHYSLMFSRKMRSQKVVIATVIAVQLSGQAADDAFFIPRARIAEK